MWWRPRPPRAPHPTGCHFGPGATRRRPARRRQRAPSAGLGTFKRAARWRGRQAGRRPSHSPYTFEPTSHSAAAAWVPSRRGTTGAPAAPPRRPVRAPTRVRAFFACVNQRGFFCVCTCVRVCVLRRLSDRTRTSERQGRPRHCATPALRNAGTAPRRAEQRPQRPSPQRPLRRCLHNALPTAAQTPQRHDSQHARRRRFRPGRRNTCFRHTQALPRHTQARPPRGASPASRPAPAQARRRRAAAGGPRRSAFVPRNRDLRGFVRRGQGRAQPQETICHSAGRRPLPPCPHMRAAATDARRAAAGPV